MLPSYRGEDFNYQYGNLDYKGKTVLDLGAEFGSTAAFFVRKGAKLVIAVEGSQKYLRNLRRNATILGNVIPVTVWITRPETLSDLILRYRPEVAKVDCEGCEVHLFKVPDHVFSLIPEYIIETHSDKLLEQMVNKCNRNNYEIYHIIPWAPQVNIVFARQIF